jgi:large subunit ribosomal protein L10
MDRQTKHQQVANLKEELKDISTIFLCNFQGLTVDKDTALRSKVRESGSEYAVVKNTLLKIAFADSDFAKVNDHLVGNTAVAYSKEDPVGLAKLLKDFAKDNEKFEFKAGVVEGQVIDVKGLEALASLPPKEVLISKLMFMLNFPVQGLVNALSGNIRNLAVVLGQIQKQKEENS